MTSPETLPTTLGGHVRRHIPAYAMGGIVLGAFQLAMNRIDWQSKAAIDDIFSSAPDAAARHSLFILGLALFAFAARISSRWFIFNAGLSSTLGS